MYEKAKLKLCVGMRKLPEWTSLMVVAAVSILFWRWAPRMAEIMLADQNTIYSITRSNETAAPVMIIAFLILGGMKYVFSKFGEAAQV